MSCRWSWESLKCLKKRNFVFAFKRLARVAEWRTVKRELRLKAKDHADTDVPGRDDDYIRSSNVDREKQSQLML